MTYGPSSWSEARRHSALRPFGRRDTRYIQGSVMHQAPRPSRRRPWHSGLQFALLLALGAVALHAQPLRVAIRDIDARHLPRVRLKVELTRGGVPLLFPKGAAFTLYENGRDVAAEQLCPDSSSGASIAMVLDNSGSMSGGSFLGLKVGALSVTAMLGPGDREAVYDFAAGGRRIAGYTSDTAVLNSAIRGMTPGANTPLYHTMAMALADLAAQPPGPRFLVVFTDGMDNGSTVGPDEVADSLLAQGVTLFMIGYGGGMLDHSVIATAAEQSGGYYERVYSSESIAGHFSTIGGEMLSPYCTLTYAGDCGDSLRLLHLDADLNGEHAEADTSYRSPFRAESVLLRAAGPGQLRAGQSGIAYVDIAPDVSMGLPLTFTLLLRYDPALLAPTSLFPVTLGTACQNADVSMQLLRPGTLRIAAQEITPGMAGPHLVGASFRALVADSSRPVIITVDSAVIGGGCPASARLEADTIDVCQCFGALALTADSVAVVDAGEPAAVTLRWSGTAAGPQELRAILAFDDPPLEIAGVQPLDADWDLRITPVRPGAALLTGTSRGGASTGGVTLLLRSLPADAPQRAHTTLERLRVYALCCDTAASFARSVIVDGRCRGLALRKDGLRVSAHPTPATQRVTFTVEWPDRQPASTDDVAVLRVFDMTGACRIETTCALRGTTGRAACDISPLAPGVYLVAASCGSAWAGATLVVGE